MSHSSPVQVADEVGDLEIHCRYGCKPRDGFPGEYEHNQQGTYSSVSPILHKFVREHDQLCCNR